MSGKDEKNREKIFAVFLKKSEVKSEGDYCKREAFVHTAVVKLWNSSGARKSEVQLAEAYTE